MVQKGGNKVKYANTSEGLNPGIQSLASEPLHCKIHGADGIQNSGIHPRLVPGPPMAGPEVLEGGPFGVEKRLEAEVHQREAQHHQADLPYVRQQRVDTLISNCPLTVQEVIHRWNLAFLPGKVVEALANYARGKGGLMELEEALRNLDTFVREVKWKKTIQREGTVGFELAGAGGTEKKSVYPPGS